MIKCILLCLLHSKDCNGKVDWIEGRVLVVELLHCRCIIMVKTSFKRFFYQFCHSFTVNDLGYHFAFY